MDRCTWLRPRRLFPSLSFEFFPPHSPEAQPAAVALGRAAGAAGAALRLGDLRGRRHHAGPHQRGDPDDPRAGAAERRGAPDLRRRQPRGDAGGGARLCPAGRAANRGAARRPAQGRDELRAASGRLRQRGRAGGRRCARSGTSRSRWAPIRRCIRRRRAPATDVENLKRKIDAGASHGADAVLLRQRGVPALPRCLRRGGDHGADPSGHPAGGEFRQDGELRRPLQSLGAGVDAQGLRAGGDAGGGLHAVGGDRLRAGRRR